ncbi:Acyltransferase [Dictyocaulus viviparus]|uniref:Acyltransferase n=1 Tax=Dictyocaulus viviparus TaxID=29172 RepID=A0A0D8Y793_DICVI|nr:Acyltransferase [Dictyocaulus viviparus]
MILSALVAAVQARAAIPYSLLSLSMIPFATASLGIGALSWIVPRKVTQTLDNALYRAYMRLCLFVFENVSGVQLKLYGDIDKLRDNPDHALVMANHQSDVDWAVLVMLAQRQGQFGNDAGFRVMVKDIIHYVPLFGWYIYQHGYIYVRRFGEFLPGPVLKQLSWLDSLQEPFWLLIFPEGTRYSKRKKETLCLNEELSRRNDTPGLKNLLVPRAGGMFLALERLNSLDGVYDVTIAYGQTRLPNRRGLAPSMVEFVCGEQCGMTVSVYVKKYPVKDLRRSRERFREWIMEVYLEKDRLLETYYNTGEFPDPMSLNEPAVSFLRTLPPTVCFLAALVAPFYFPSVRYAYLCTIASFPFLIFWLEAKKCV